jgi:hypothetical protein
MPLPGRLYMLMAFLFLLSVSVLPAEEPKAERHWYRFEVQTGDTTYQCIGSSPLDEEAMAKQLTADGFIILDNAAYMGTQGKIKSWKSWDPKASERLMLHTRYIILVNPLNGDPRRSGTGK